MPKASSARWCQPTRAYLAPSRQPLDFTYATGCVDVTVPTVEIHQMVVLE